MNASYSSRPAHPSEPRGHRCIVAGCREPEPVWMLWVTLTDRSAGLDVSRRLGACCGFHAVAVPEAGIQGYSFTEHRTRPAVVTPT